MPTDIALALGKTILAKMRRRRGTQAAADDIQLVLAEESEAEALSDILIARAAAIRGNRSCFQVTDKLLVRIPALPHGTLAEMQEEYDGIESIERDTSTTLAVTMSLATVVLPREEIGGAAYERRTRRLRDEGRILGFAHRRWLAQHQDDAVAIPSARTRAVLRQLMYRVEGIGFSGTIAAASVGLVFPSLGRGQSRWGSRWPRFESGAFGADSRIAIVGRR